MIDINIFKEFIKILEKYKTRYWVFGGLALDGLRGRITRNHSDVDVYISYKDIDAVLKYLPSEKYAVTRDGNKYSVTKHSTNITLVVLADSKDGYIAYSNKKITYYPKDIFRKVYTAQIANVKFSIAPSEVLVFKTKYSRHDADKEFSETIKHDPKIQKKIWYKPINRK